MCQEKSAKKQVLVLAIFILVTTTREKVFGNTETSENGENSKNGDKDENLKTNFMEILYI